jgi:hypothetical protein
MSARLPGTRFSTLAETLRRLAERGAANALKKELRLTDSQVEYITKAVREASVALSEMAKHELVIRCLVEDEE